MSYIEHTKSKLKSRVLQIDRHIDRYRDHKIWEIFDHKRFSNNDTINQLWKHMLDHIREHNTRPAKRLRASLLYYTYQLFAKDPDYQTVQSMQELSISLELVHTWLLIHDDYQDQDDLRRGVVTTHKYYEQYAKDNKLTLDQQHFGAGMAINTGDMALTLWYQQVLKIDSIDPIKKIEILDVLFDGIIHTAFGQAMDLMLEGIHEVDDQIILWVQNSKTGIYTYQTPMLMWAILAGVDNHVKKILTKYAIYCGIAFQIQDDMIGIFGDPATTGKSDYNDIIKWKKTLLYLKTLELAWDEDKQFFVDHYGKAGITIDQAEQIKSIIVSCGAYQANLELAQEYANNALETFKLIEDSWAYFDKDTYNYFIGMAEYMWVARDK